MENTISVKGKALCTIVYRGNVIKAGETFTATFTNAEYKAFKKAKCFEEIVEKKTRTESVSVKK